MYRPFFAVLIVVISVNSVLNAQENIPLESWRMHIAYNNVLHLTEGDNKVFAAVKNGVFYFDKEDNSINTITKINGLSDVGISALAFSNENNLLIIGYENGNLDVWTATQIININDLLNSNINLSKRINHINIYGNLCFIATDFGMLKLDLTTLKITESIQNLGGLGEPLVINESTVYSDSLFLATENGIIAASLSSNVNILDFNNWKRFGVSDNAPTTEIISIVSYNNGMVAAEKNGNVFSYQNSFWSISSFSTPQQHNKLFATQESLLISSSLGITEVKGTVVSSFGSIGLTINFALKDEDGIVWAGSKEKGLLKINNDNLEEILPEGPSFDNVTKLYFHENKMFALSGGIGNGGIPLSNNNGFSVFENGFWNNYSLINFSNMASNLVDVIYNPIDQLYYMSSYGEGLQTFDGDNSINKIDNTTTPFESWTVNTNYILTTGLAANSEGIWAANYGVSFNSLHHKNSDQIWSSYSQSMVGSNVPVSILIAENGDKWIGLDPNQGGKVVVFNEVTGKSRKLTNEIGKGNLPQNDVYDIAIDNNGLIWMATGKGVAYFTSTYAVDNQSPVDATTPIIDNYPLLRDEQVTAIAIDGGNRKWFGTTNGIWLLDENTQKEIYYFNTENSPLISNEITDIDINDITGEVFIATNNGLVSFRSPATRGTSKHQSVKIFPNPVESNFEGLVGITGVVDQAIIKITDISGQLVWQARANGGTLGWNVKDSNNNRVSTGMYFVFSSSDDGEEFLIGKIAIVD